jgi:hypothetical protein
MDYLHHKGKQLANYISLESCPYILIHTLLTYLPFNIYEDIKKKTTKTVGENIYKNYHIFSLIGLDFSLSQTSRRMGLLITQIMTKP